MLKEIKLNKVDRRHGKRALSSDLDASEANKKESCKSHQAYTSPSDQTQKEETSPSSFFSYHISTTSDTNTFSLPNSTGQVIGNSYGLTQKHDPSYHSTPPQNQGIYLIEGPKYAPFS